MIKMAQRKKQKEKKSNILLFFLIVLLLIGAFIVRLYKINTTLSDHHSWRQVDTASVTRNYSRNGIDLLHPKYDDLSSIQSGKDNPEGYRMVEFPFYNAISASLYSIILQSLSIETISRLVTIFFSLTMIISVYFIVRKEYSNLTALSSVFFLSFYPFSIFFSRTVLPDTMAISLTITSLAIFLYSFYNQNKFIKGFKTLTALLLFALAILVKPTVIFYGIVFLAILIKEHGIKFFRSPTLYLIPFTILPFILWRWWILQYPEGIPGSQWLITSVNTYKGLEKIFFKPAFFRWIFIERIQNLILGGPSIFFVLLGVLNTKRNLTAISIGIASLLYLFTFQGGNVQHDYYQIMILPSIAVFFGIGINSLFNNRKSLFQIITITVFCVSIISMSILYSWYSMSYFYGTNESLYNISQIIKTITPKESKIVTDTIGDTTLLYLSDRKGYPAPILSWEELKKRNMDYFVTMKEEVGEDLKNKLKLVLESDSVYIFKL